MNDPAARLATRVVAWQLGFSAVTAAALTVLSSFLLLLSGPAAVRSAIALSAAVIVGGTLAAGYSWRLAWRRRYLLRRLVLRSDDVDLFELPKLNDEPWRIVSAWLLTSVLALLLFTTVWRPLIISPETGLTLGLLGGVVVATLALPLLLLIRKEFVKALELAPAEAMREIIEAQERMGRLRGRTSRRLLAALTTPVLLLSIGVALIANAHLREADTREQRETARAVALAMEDDAALDRTGAVDGRGSASLTDAALRALSPKPLIIALLAMSLAVVVGLALTRVLSNDLKMANDGVRMLGTDAALEGTKVMKPARLWAVAELGRAIESLSNRFRQFARAQERAIQARESATRMRGLFFASVSHDLKSPLNAILGFAELVRSREALSPGQQESLDLIMRRGRELLALIETILDAARVEAGQLTLLKETMSVGDLIAAAVDKGKDLSSDADVVVISEIAEGIPKLRVDRARLPQALATFIGHARRSAVRPSMRIRAAPRERQTTGSGPALVRLRIDIEIPSARFTAQELTALLDPERQPGQHRGLALGLRLARSIVEHHGGRVRVTGHTVVEPAFSVELPL